MKEGEYRFRNNGLSNQLKNDTKAQTKPKSLSRHFTCHIRTRISPIRHQDTFLAASKNTSLFQERHTFVLSVHRSDRTSSQRIPAQTRRPQPRRLLPALPVLTLGCLSAPRPPPSLSCFATSLGEIPRSCHAQSQQGTRGEGAALRAGSSQQHVADRPGERAGLSPRQRSRAWRSVRAGSPSRAQPPAQPLPAAASRPGEEPSSPANAPHRARRRPRGASPRPRPPSPARVAARRRSSIPARPPQGRAGHTCTARLRKVPASAASFFTLKSMMFIFGGGGGADSARTPAAAAAAPARPCGQPPGAEPGPARPGAAADWPRPRRQPQSPDRPVERRPRPARPSLAPP